MIMNAEVLGVENGFLMVLDKSSDQEVAVNTRCLNFNVGERIKIIYNGIMTFSLPPQINACRIIKIDNDSEIYLQRYREILNAMISGMCSAELNDSISHNFIVQMIPHHRAAIEMSENILKYTENAKLTEIAKGIIDEQTRSIADMEAVLDQCSTLLNCSCDVQVYQRNVNAITETMFSKMRSAYFDNCINCDFIREMIPHHEGAVRMSENALKFQICHELNPILNAIIISQKNGIHQMKCLAENIRCSHFIQ